MSISKDELFDIFRKYASKEFADIPLNDDNIDYEFSDKFERKMLKIIKKVGSGKKAASKNYKRTIAVLIAAIIAMLAGAMSVGAVRDAVIGFVYEKIGNNYEISFEGDAPESLDYIYSFSVIPEGFVETYRDSGNSYNYVRYDNDETKKCIVLHQSATGGIISISMDGENGHVEKYDVNGTEINIYISDYGDAYTAYWIWDVNYLQLEYHGKGISIDDIIKIIKTIV